MGFHWHSYHRHWTVVRGYPRTNAIGASGYYCSESESFDGSAVGIETITFLFDNPVHFNSF